MVKLSRILKDYQQSGAVNALVNVHAALDEHTFLTKSGDVMAVLAVQGADYECLDAPQIDRIARRFGSALRIFDENFRIYQYLLKRDGAPIPHRHYINPVVQEAVTNRVAYLNTKADSLYSLEIYFAVVYEGRRRAGGLHRKLSEFITRLKAAMCEVLSTETKTAVLEEGLERAREALASKVNSFVVHLEDSVRVEVLDKERAFRFIRRLLNYAPAKADGVRLKYDAFVDFQACDSALECHRDHLRLDDYYVQVLTLKEPPAQTFAHLLKGLLEIPSNLIIATEWKRETNLKMRKLIQSKRRHFHNSKTSIVNYLNNTPAAPKDMLVDDAAAALSAELGSCLEELEVRGNYFGRFSLTVVLYDEDRDRVKRSSSEVFKVFATQDAHLIEERYNLLNAFLAVLPGNDAYNLRTLWLLNWGGPQG